MKKLKKDVTDFTKAGMGLGFGTAMISATGQGASVLPAFSTAGRMMRPVGTAMMGMHTLRILKKSYKRKK